MHCDGLNRTDLPIYLPNRLVLSRLSHQPAEEFAELEQAYRLLLDKDAKGALDDLLR